MIFFKKVTAHVKVILGQCAPQSHAWWELSGDSSHTSEALRLHLVCLRTAMAAALFQPCQSQVSNPGGKTGPDTAKPSRLSSLQLAEADPGADHILEIFVRQGAGGDLIALPWYDYQVPPAEDFSC